MPKILLEGRPGSGKTTVARRFLQLLQDDGIEVRGFTTEEIREKGRRVGFAVETARGERAVLAHVKFKGPVRVGKYGVDLESFERIALPALAGSLDGVVVVVDELGKMELGSDAFVDRMAAVLDASDRVLATIHTFRHSFTDEIKGRRDVDVMKVTSSNRDSLPEELVDLFA